MERETPVTDWIGRISAGEHAERLAALVAEGGTVCARGIVGSSACAVAAALRRRRPEPMLLVTAHLDDADEAADELEAMGIDAARFPAMEMLPGESTVSLELLSERLTIVRRLIDGPAPAVTTAPVHALMQAVPKQQALQRTMRVLRVGDRLEMDDLAAWLTEGGYSRVQTIESPGEFAVRGGIVDVFGPSGAAARLDFFGNEIEGLFDIDLETMGSDRKRELVELVGVSAEVLQPADDGAISLLEYLPAETTVILAELIEINEQGRSYLDRATDASGLMTVGELFKTTVERSRTVLELSQYSTGSDARRAEALPVEALPAFAESAAEAVGELAELARRLDTIVLCQNEGEVHRMKELLAESAPGAPVRVHEQYLHRGFIWDEAAGSGRGLALVPYHEILHRYHIRRKVRRVAARSTDRFLEFEPGDFVVHRDHGIARFLGLDRLKGADTQEEFLTLEFAGRSKLHVPAAKIELVQKYLGAFQGTPQLSHLGGRKWANQKQAVSEAVRDLAAEMLRIQAARESTPGIRYPADTAWQTEFEAEFPYEETDDQLAAISAVKRDMSDMQPADRLICGDVGFGKTEVAIRAAFKAAEYGKQVAVLVPTTVLAEQHERTFRARFADYPFRVESISRFKTGKHQQEILDALRQGRVDIIIGTHRLLSKDVRFADLGLVIIDEEQRFGVQHKQRLLAFRLTADVLTLSATPIPRTLHMAMLNLRDISSLTTPPLDRRAIVTEVISYDENRIARAIERELAREGQVYFVHNRVHNIQSVADRVRALVPEARVLIGHGQMPSRQLESVMLKFLRREADILICTTIIESGIDIPTTNTMFVSNADSFGLSELHQLRGRVGRYKHRAYCYLLLPTDRMISEVAMRRLQAIEQFSMLGAGFRIALRDLEIRGAGNLLGPQQSGHIAAVGYDMYCRLLEHAVADLTDETTETSIDTVVDIGIAGSLPRGYIPSTARRMEAYRRASGADSPEEVAAVEQDLTSAYGAPPPSAVTLLRLAELRVLATMHAARSVTRHEGDIIFAAEKPEALKSTLDGAQGTVRIVGGPDRKGLTQVYYRPPPAYLDGDSILTVLLQRLRPEAKAAPVAV
ncbi:MAG: transcription-repair coupling factor [Planctomycetota bacterium]|jgi:transcription-repair coupling factor (superfamily II helicase)